jgi:hypothetical protein
MAIRRFSTAEPGVKSNKFWDQDTAQGAMVPIASLDFANNVTFGFGNIPQTFQDLMIVINGTVNTSGVLVMDDFNLGSPTCSHTALLSNGSSISTVKLNSNGAALPLTTGSSQTLPNTNSFIIHMLDYANSSRFKTVLSRKSSDNDSTGNLNIITGLVQTTSAITYFKFSTQNLGVWFNSGQATLYGIKAGA